MTNQCEICKRDHNHERFVCDGHKACSMDCYRELQLKYDPRMISIKAVELRSMEKYGNKYQRIKDFDGCVIYGRRWFRKSAGNTYHSVIVYVDGIEIGRNEYAYGYGEHYIQTAHTLLQVAGYYEDTGKGFVSGADVDYCMFMEDMRENRNKFVVQVTDVERQKDLKF